MSISTPMASTPLGEFQAHFGNPPGFADPAAQCKQWEKLCGELLAERDKLRAELDQMRRMYEACEKALFHHWCQDFKPEEFDEAIGFANLDERPTVRELIAEFEKARE